LERSGERERSKIVDNAEAVVPFLGWESKPEMGLESLASTLGNS
jgi:hypothetical protein